MTHTDRLKLRLFFRYYTVIFIISLLLLGSIAYVEINRNIKTIKLREYGSVLLKVKTIENYLKPVVTDITMIISDQILQDFVNENSIENKKKLQIDFLGTAEVRSLYDQIRFIDSNGMEIVRVNNNNGNPLIVPDNKLQSKKDRYYFKKTIALNKDEIYASRFDLNIEGGKIEKPIKPMIRIGIPVFDREGNKKGIVIINYLGSKLLDEFAENNKINSTVILSSGVFWLINNDGYYLKGPSKEKEWTFMYNNKKDISFKNDYPDVWKKISSNSDGQLPEREGLFTYVTVNPFSHIPDGDIKISVNQANSNYQWKVLSFVPRSVLLEKAYGTLLKFFLIFIFINIMAVLGTLLNINASIKNKDTEERIKVLLKRRNAFQEILIKLYQTEFKDLDSGLYELINSTYAFMDVDCLLIWKFDKDNKNIKCLDIPMGPEQKPPVNKKIRTSDYPDYFTKILNGEQISIEDTLEDHVTVKLSKDLLVQNNIRAILDSPIWCHGKIIGILSMGKKGSTWKWSEEEKYFALHIASAAAAIFETSERLEAETKMGKALKEAESANKTKSEFLANMSHEIRTPMNSILGFSEILMQRIKDKEEHEFIKAINTSGTNLLSLINDILDLSKIDSNKIEIIENIVDIRNIISDLEGFFKIKLISKNLDFVTEVSEPIPETLIIDETRLRQILINLIGNAIKFTEKGFVKISIHTEPKEYDHSLTLVIDIEDTGIGISKENRKKIFDPFEQAGKGSLAKYGGTGLGLAITQRLVNLMNGSINIIDKTGPGTIFRVKFYQIKEITT